MSRLRRNGPEIKAEICFKGDYTQWLIRKVNPQRRQPLRKRFTFLVDQVIDQIVCQALGFFSKRFP